MTWQTLRCGKGETSGRFSCFTTCLIQGIRHVCESRHLRRYKEKLCLQSSEEDWSKSIPHFAGTQTWTRGSEQVYSAFPSQDSPPPYRTKWTREQRFHRKSLHQVLIRENQNVLRGGKKPPKPPAQLLGLLPQAAQPSHSTVVRAGWLCLPTRRSCPHPCGEPLLTRTPTLPFFIPATPPCCGLIGLLHAETSHTASTGSLYLNLGTV